MQFTVHLKQHTPIIHFQHTHTGATLRGSELKPKLDRFLRGKIDEKEFGEKGNLDYKVRIRAEGKDIQKIDNRHPLFFGNMGIPDNESEKRKEFVTAQNVSISFFSFKSRVINVIKAHFEAFLANTNFGTRQSKGFGGFYIKNKTFNPNLIEGNVSKVYKFKSAGSEGQLYKDIAWLYAMLRSGINQVNGAGGTFYGKSLMFLYAKNKGITWDKKAIKQHYFSRKLGKQTGDHKKEGHDTEVLTYSTEEKRLMRDLLGLSSEQSWRIHYHSSITKHHVNIERYPSPIIFKPINTGKGYDVYFWARQMDADILGETFRIRCNNLGSLDLDTPKNFDIADFLDFAAKTDMTTHIEGGYHGHPIFKRLLAIFAQL